MTQSEIENPRHKKVPQLGHKNMPQGHKKVPRRVGHKKVPSGAGLDRTYS